MIAVIDTWTDFLIRQHIESHIDLIVWTHVPYSNRELWHRLGEELLDRYARTLFPDEEEVVLHPYVYDRFQELVRAFVLKRREIRNAMTRIADNPPHQQVGGDVTIILYRHGAGNTEILAPVIVVSDASQSRSLIVPVAARRTGFACAR
jgi:hypothetical protein